MPAESGGIVTFPETVPPPTTIFALASILPLMLVLDPIEITVPVEPDELAAVILPPTMLLLVSVILSPEWMLAPINVTLPVVCTNFLAPTRPPLIVMDEPIRVVPIPSGPVHNVKSLGMSTCPFEL